MRQLVPNELGILNEEGAEENQTCKCSLAECCAFGKLMLAAVRLDLSKEHVMNQWSMDSISEHS
jgi:hypothetical protein